MRSVVVVYRQSMWAMMPMLRVALEGVLTLGHRRSLSLVFCFVRGLTWSHPGTGTGVLKKELSAVTNHQR